MQGAASAGSAATGQANPRELPARMADRLIVALDVPTPEQAAALVAKLDDTVSFYKIGLWLLFAKGTDKLIDDLISRGRNVFLDYKMYDIGETVREGVKRARDRGVKFITVHGDDEIMQAAADGKGGNDFLKVFAISVLTSMGDADLHGMGYRLSVKDLVAHRVRRAVACGIDGMIASAADDPNALRRTAESERLLITTPGIRPTGAGVHDHKRSTTPTEAIRNGADYLVVGRPIVAQDDPAAQARQIIAQMEVGARS